MKLGDMVKYDSARYDGYANYPGLVIKRYTQNPYRPGLSDREMVDVLFPYGVVSDDTYEFEVINETR
tara:strand:- start:22 stop:222 length:201 start_codon:yes stop_codon:yes gene_type:complete